MKIKELLGCLTKYYRICIGDRIHEDQTVVSENLGEEEVSTFDFYDDPYEGESIVIRPREKK